MEWREGKSTKYLYQKDGDVLLVSYVDKKKKKNVVRVMKDERKKPRVHTIYDHTKGVLMWLILYLLINLLASNLPDDRWMS